MNYSILSNVPYDEYAAFDHIVMLKSSVFIIRNATYYLRQRPTLS